MSKWEYTETELWRFGVGEVSILHVFGLIGEGKNVVAFAEARHGGGGDAGCPHDIWMRRSRNGGRSFTESVCLCPSDGRHVWTNPVPVYDRCAKRLFLFYSDNLDNHRTENYLISSDDWGESWSSPQRINHWLEEGKRALPFHLAGPGHGIQLTRGEHAGRLLVPFWHRQWGPDHPAAERGYCAFVLYSDDSGRTWRHTACTGHACQANEARIAETREGLLWIIRPIQPCRYASRSLDGGTTWSEPIPMSLGPANNCDAGAVSVTGKGGYEDMVLISRVSGLRKRENMEVLISLDGGESFVDRMALPEGDAMPGYSDLCVLEEDEPVVGLLHCRNNHVLFSRISLQTLTGGKYENTSRRVWLG